jgi:DNA-binding transcriptional LysR family regulator
MTIEQLRIFLAVAQHLHFTRAAESLFVTQPAVSAAVQNIEEEYSVKLFHRIGRRVELTQAGRLLRVEAQKILDQVELTKRGLRELNNLQQGELKLGSSFTIANYWLPARISQFKQKYPGITIDCTLANADEICDGTANGQFDFGIVSGIVNAEHASVLEQEVIGQERLQIVVGQTHPWFTQTTVPAQDLYTTTWIMREPGSGAQQSLEQSLQAWGLTLANLNVTLILSSSEMVKAVVESGSGAAALPELMVQKELLLGTLQAIEIVDCPVPTYGKSKNLEIVQPVLMLKHKQRFQTRIAKAFEQLLGLPLE